MKKFLSVVLLWLTTSMVQAQQTVQVVWPFSIASSHAGLVRALIDSANAQQSEYQFIFVNKPGAGGSVAANAVQNSKELSVLTATSSFYIRPMLYKNSHSYDGFSLINEICSDQPLALFSKKIKKISDVPADKTLTVGIIQGSITNLVAQAIVENNRSVKMVEVNYKGSPEATTDMLAGHIDASVDFIGPTATERFTGTVYTLGITGVSDRLGMKTFQSQGIKGLDHVTHSMYIFVRNDVPANLKQRLAEIFNKAGMNNSQARRLCEQEGGFIPTISYDKMEQIHNTNINRWIALTKNIPKQ